MKKFIIIVFITSLYFTQNLFSQQDTIKSNSVLPQDSLGRHLWYIELAGVNFGISFNYEYIFLKETTYDLSIRTGIGGYNFFFSRFGFPLMVNFILGKEYCLDLEIGILFDKYYKQEGYDYSTQAIKFVGNIGYRYVSEGGFIFRIGLTPIYHADSGFLPIIGISFGGYF